MVTKSHKYDVPYRTAATMHNDIGSKRRQESILISLRVVYRQISNSSFSHIVLMLIVFSSAVTFAVTIASQYAIADTSVNNSGVTPQTDNDSVNTSPSATSDSSAANDQSSNSQQTTANDATPTPETSSANDPSSNQNPTPTPVNGWYNFGDLTTERWYQNGEMVVSQLFTDPNTGNRYYAEIDGSIAHDIDVTVPFEKDQITIRLAHDGHMITGFSAQDSNTYYFDPSTGAMVHGERNIDGNWYYFDANTGAMARGIVHVSSNGGKWVYYDIVTGIMAHGERYINYAPNLTGWYYFDQWTGKMAHGNVYVPAWGKWYWTGIDGILQGDTPGKTGWQNPAAFYQVSSKNVRTVGQGLFSYIQPSRLSPTASREDAINIFIQTALNYLGSPYKWDYALWPGGGTDCAGLVISSMESVGMQTPYNAYDHRFQAWQDHDADNMWNDPRIMKVAIKDRQRGDLVFYPGHVAIYLGNDTIINAYPPQVEYDSIWRWGIRGVGRLFI